MPTPSMPSQPRPTSWQPSTASCAMRRLARLPGAATAAAGRPTSAARTLLARRRCGCACGRASAGAAATPCTQTHSVAAPWSALTSVGCWRRWSSRTARRGWRPWKPSPKRRACCAGPPPRCASCHQRTRRGLASSRACALSAWRRSAGKRGCGRRRRSYAPPVASAAWWRSAPLGGASGASAGRERRSACLRLPMPREPWWKASVAR
mmetsp:Transcript_40188/g.101109  ORF Transcript_40188/g.101109 Transcript_40188/m.101109 type:complete len:208 (-) Transcript_40188:306-929(-)